MIKRSIGTHDGSFHADEVTACALLVLFGLGDKDKIVRSRDPDVLKDCEYVCDVGGVYAPELKRFDHHQSEYTGDLSSAGMVWLYMLQQGIVDEATFAFFNRSLVHGVDAHDIGKETVGYGICTFSHVIANFVPVVYDSAVELQSKAFFEAFDFALGHLTRLLQRFRYIQACEEKVVASMQKREKFLYFEQALPWMDCFFAMGGNAHPAQFVVMPTGKHWKLRGIPPTLEDKMKVRTPLPLEWAGLLDEELQRVSGIPGAIFCHKGRFISVWKTREDALKALEHVLSGVR